MNQFLKNDRVVFARHRPDPANEPANLAQLLGRTGVVVEVNPDHHPPIKVEFAEAAEWLWPEELDLVWATCPQCGARELREVDLVYGYATVGRVLADGSIEWAGDTDVDWDSQFPAHDPAKFVCRACGAESALVGGEFIPYPETEAI